MNKDKAFNYKKKYGQNFLQDNNVLDNIIKESEILPNTLVIEIGLGAGALTKRLCKAAKWVIGYEIDTNLKETLDSLFNDKKNVNIIFDDFLKRNVKEDIKNYEYEKLMVVANLPYYITTPIISKFIEERIPVDKMVLMVQDEVADRFNAKVGSKNYNSLTIYLKYYFNIRKAFVVSRNCFYPKPNVESAVVVFSKNNHDYKVINEDKFFKLVKDSFRQKRKTLKNNLYNYDIDIIDSVLKESGKNIGYRAENIDIDEFVSISNALCSKKK